MSLFTNFFPIPPNLTLHVIVLIKKSLKITIQQRAMDQENSSASSFEDLAHINEIERNEVI